MTIPNITIAWCQRVAECEWCHQNIDAGEPLVTLFFWNKGTPEHKGFNVKKYFHPNCWVEQALDYLARNPYVPYIRKEKLELSPEDSKQRYIILKRKGSIDQRKRNVVDGNTMVLAQLDEQIAELMIQIAPLGGIPKRWLETNI